jgi:hypothetical protein
MPSDLSLCLPPLLPGWLGTQMTNSFMDSLKEAGANLLPSIWAGGSQASPAASSSGAADSSPGLDDLALDSKKSLLQSLKDGEFTSTRGEMM